MLFRSLDQLRIEQLRLREDAGQAHRLQNLLAFKEQFVSQTLAAQVIGSSGSDQSRLLYLDKGSADGIKSDMAVVTPDGVVGKVIRADHGTSTVLLINDQLSGVGAMLEKSRLQGIVRGTPSGALLLRNIMNDEKVEVGDLVLSSGGDRVFPKGMPIGRIKSVAGSNDIFFNIELNPAANLGRLEEVLVITKLDDRSPKFDTAGPVRAADVRADRLPIVPPAPRSDANGNPLPTSLLPAPGANTQSKAPAALAAMPPTVKSGSVPVRTASTQIDSAGTATDSKPKPVLPVAVGRPNSGPATATQGSTTASTGVAAGAKPANKPKRADAPVAPVMGNTPPVQRSTPAEPDSSASSGESQPSTNVAPQEKPVEGAAKPATKPKPNATDGPPGSEGDPAAPKPPKPTPQASPSIPQRGAR